MFSHAGVRKATSGSANSASLTTARSCPRRAAAATSCFSILPPPANDSRRWALTGRPHLLLLELPRVRLRTHLAADGALKLHVFREHVVLGNKDRSFARRIVLGRLRFKLH